MFQVKQVRKLRWSVAFVTLENCDLISLLTLVPPGQCAVKQPLTKQVRKYMDDALFQFYKIF